MMGTLPLGSQLFLPLQSFEYLVAFADQKETINSSDVVLFQFTLTQGVNYKSGTWHHPILMLPPQQDFLVVDRGGEENNLVEQKLDTTIFIELEAN